MRSIIPATQAQSRFPVWGAKPLLSYFVLTPNLFEIIRSELGLTSAQQTLLRQVALSEAQNLRALEKSSLAIVQDEGLSLAEKRARIDLGGYNQQVLIALQSTQTGLQSGLEAGVYTRLVYWIEQRWLVERELHGIDALKETSGSRVYSIYATRFDTDSYIVALPDKCLKLANGGYHTRDDSGYAVGQNYSVRLSTKLPLQPG